jgi:eukaryotic-like serine/threonine-protein kinase
MIGGRFTLGPPVGRGGMGTVHVAYDERLHRRVALKQLSFFDDVSRRRFRREARLTARLDHPGVPAVYDLGDDYIAMEYVEGHSLRDLIAELAPVSDAWAAALGLQVAAVLACAHRISLIHRDLKPSNILVTATGAVKVIDFGIATLVGAEEPSTLTPPGAMLGSPTYRAPETGRGSTGPGTDLYALGCVLHELGAAGLSTVVSALTAHRPSDRLASASALIAELRPLTGGLDPLPGFVPDPRRVNDITAAYVDLADPVLPHEPTELGSTRA